MTVKLIQMKTTRRKLPTVLRALFSGVLAAAFQLGTDQARAGYAITTLPASAISADGATLNGTVNPNGLNAAYVSFQFSTNATFPLTTQTNIGSGYNWPTGVATDPFGNVWVCNLSDGNNPRVITPNGSTTNYASGTGSCDGIALDSLGNLYLAANPSDLIETINLNTAALGPLIHGVLNPGGLALDGAGNLYVNEGTDSSGTVNGVVEEYPADHSSPKQVVSGISPRNAGYGLAVDAAGDIFVPELTAGIVEYQTNGAVRTFNVNLGSSPVDWFGVTVNAAGDVFGCGTYLTSDRSADLESVVEFSHDGTTNIITISPQGSSVLYAPRGMTFDTVGQLYIADTVYNRVVKLSPPTVAANPPSPNGSNPVAVSAALTGLTPNTTYYVRAVTVGLNGTLVGATQSFTTPDVSPIFTNVDNATFAVGQSNSFTFTASRNPVFSESGALPAGVSLSATGILSGNPSVAGTFPITVTASNGLSHATQNFTLTVVNLRPALVTPTAYYVKTSTATLNVVLASSGASPVTQFGFLLAPAAVNPNPTVGGNGVIEFDSPNPNSTLYQLQVNSLTPSTLYSLVAFAVNSYGLAYSSVTNFTTSPGPVGSLVVNTLLDVTNTPGLNGLRDAIAYAYQLNDVATITFNPSLFASGPGTLTISNPIFIQGLGGKLTFRGPGPNLLTLSGNDQTQIFNNSGPDVEFDNLTMSHCNGGAIISAYNLSCSNVVFASNRAGNGGAIWSIGPLTLSNCTFTNNLATVNGGAVTCYQGLTISGSTFANNRCGIDANGNTNAAGGLGGAVYAFQSGYPLQVVNSTFVGNHAYNGNGGALELGLGAGSIANSTITGNTADGFGGGLDAGYNYSVPINNTIVSGNFAATNSDVNDSAGYTATNSLIGADAASIFGGSTLANNGGPTPTLALDPNGPAINAGNNPLLPGITTDQRGLPRINSGTVDIGAYEFQFAPPIITSGNSTVFLTSFSNHFSITASGLPPAVCTLSGTLPANVTFNAGVLSGTPPEGTAGTYPLTVTASNGVAPNATQSFTLTVSQNHGAVTTLDGAVWYLGAPAIGNDLSIYREEPGQIPSIVDGWASRIGLANDGNVLVENDNGGVYARIGSTNGIGSYWQLLISVTAGDGATWFLGSDGIGNDFFIYRWAAGGVPAFSDGRATTLSVSSDGLIVVRNSAGNFYRRAGSNAGFGSDWQLLNVVNTPAVLNVPRRMANGFFSFNFSSQPAGLFSVLTSTNLSTPFSNWMSLGAPIENPAGQYQFTNATATNDPRRFYQVTSP